MKKSYRSTIRLDRSKRQRLERKLLDWYRTYQRDLPWRKAKDPYPIWISEVMLQQTQVQTVIPYYLKFLQSFPTIQHLAKADTQQLLRVWAGLGYYSRAHNLQKAAQKIVQTYGGKFPKTYEEILALPGIGRYTAGAILSIAFDKPYPVLDGNVVRVLTRLFKLKGDPKSSVLQQLLWNFAQKLMSQGRPGDFNEALMELGATLCSPRQPRCLLCPWQGECLARREGIQELLPERAKSHVSERSRYAVAVIRHCDRILIVKRTDKKLLKDFWEFPGGEFNGIGDLKSALVTKIREDLGLRIRLLDPITTIKHSITKRRITLHAYRAEIKTSLKVIRGKCARWVRLVEMDNYPFAAASLQIVQALK